MSTLTPDQIDFFNTNGYLVLQRAFDADEVAAMQRAADQVLELIVNASLYNERPSGRLNYRITADGVPVVRKIQPINDLSLTFAKVADDERIAGPLQQLMGDKPILMEEKLNYKQPLPEPLPGIEGPRMDDNFPVHNDWAYFRVQDYPQNILSSALALDACTPDNGPLRVWPGSHREHLEHERIDNGLQVKPGLIDTDGGQDVLCEPGSFMIFHALLVHNSSPNRSGGPRRLMIYSHYPKAADKGIDVRNGPARLRESPYEMEYLQARIAGQARAPFQAPQAAVARP